MIKKRPQLLKIFIIFLLIIFSINLISTNIITYAGEIFPKTNESYNDGNLDSILDIIQGRIKAEPFNMVATLIFMMAIIHTLAASWFTGLAHKYEIRHKELKDLGVVDKASFSLRAGLFHFLGEVEAIFGIWVIALGFAISAFYDWETFVHYVNGLEYKEPMFIIVIMTIASSRPILKLFELFMWKIVKSFGGTLEIWWLAILILAPLLGSFITEPAAMTIGAHLLAEKFYNLNPSKRLKYATLALLFVNVSIGGSLTNFAAPPILLIADVWDWSLMYMLINFGWKAIIAILLSTTLYYILLKKDIAALKEAYALDRYRKYIQRRFISQKELESNFDDLEIEINSRVGFTSELTEVSENLKAEIKKRVYDNFEHEDNECAEINRAVEDRFEDIKFEEMRRTIPGLLPEDLRPQYHDPNWDTRDDKVPLWIMLIHVLFILWTVFNAHEPVMFIGGFLFFLGFFQITAFYQNRINLKPALLVAFFLSGLMIHGTLQGWWIGPILANLPEVGLNVTATLLTAFNDNAAITYLSSLVEGFSDSYKYAVVAGAITGGGLTVIANAPNPVGLSILKKHFKAGISSIELFKYALIPTIISGLCFMLLR